MMEFTLCGFIIQGGIHMEKVKKGWTWVKEHKTEIIIVGFTIAGTILAIKNWENVKGAIKEQLLWKCVSSTDTSTKLDVTDITDFVDAVQVPIIMISDVREHKRNLQPGYHPSASKIAEAIERGIELADNQTLVSAHQRRYAA